MDEGSMQGDIGSSYSSSLSGSSMQTRRGASGHWSSSSLSLSGYSTLSSLGWRTSLERLAVLWLGARRFRSAAAWELKPMRPRREFWSRAIVCSTAGYNQSGVIVKGTQ
eukprot:TRINITY_DN13185_c0_g1_i2.p3 TRINITY_DN13185_c0_g1~~TRINITY_DN13185_c0_g1_i2.p3  ORF type:complete len:109 (-),score=0.50 TRINITY_DN13185_c0_g1_i2:19-345(-)